MRSPRLLRALAVLFTTLPLAANFGPCGGRDDHDLPGLLQREFLADYRLDTRGFFQADSAKGRGEWSHAAETVTLRLTGPAHRVTLVVADYVAPSLRDSVFRFSAASPASYATVTLLDSLTGPVTYSTRHGGSGEVRIGQELENSGGHILSGTFRFVGYRQLPSGRTDSLLLDCRAYRFAEPH